MTAPDKRAVEWERSGVWSRAKCGPMHLETLFIYADKTWQAWAAGGCIYRETQAEAEQAAIDQAVAYARAILVGAGEL